MICGIVAFPGCGDVEYLHSTAETGVFFKMNRGACCEQSVFGIAVYIQVQSLSRFKGVTGEWVFVSGRVRMQNGRHASGGWIGAEGRKSS
jgi:hypothetical protein